MLPEERNKIKKSMFYLFYHSNVIYGPWFDEKLEVKTIILEKKFPYAVSWREIKQEDLQPIADSIEQEMNLQELVTLDSWWFHNWLIRVVVKSLKSKRRG